MMRPRNRATATNKILFLDFLKSRRAIIQASEVDRILGRKPEKLPYHLIDVHLKQETTPCKGIKELFLLFHELARKERRRERDVYEDSSTLV